MLQQKIHAESIKPNKYFRRETMETTKLQCGPSLKWATWHVTWCLSLGYLYYGRQTQLGLQQHWLGDAAARASWTRNGWSLLEQSFAKAVLVQFYGLQLYDSALHEGHSTSVSDVFLQFGEGHEPQNAYTHLPCWPGAMGVGSTWDLLTLFQVCPIKFHLMPPVPVIPSLSINS